MKRPLGVKILAVFCVISGLCGTAAGAVEAWRTVARSVELDLFAWVILLVWAVNSILGAMWIVIGVGLWKLRKWARRLVIVLSALAIGTVSVSLILKHFNPDSWMPAPWYLLLVGSPYSLFLIYMFSRDVKRAFST